MPYTVEQLTTEHRQLISICRTDPLKVALERMIEHDFSQLPVVEPDMTLLGMVTSSSIMRAVNNFGTTVDCLQVAHAMVTADKHFRDDDLFELLDNLRDEYAVVIVDGDNKAVGIVTSYDTTEYFRRRAQDMMYVEDIESALKEYISSAFTSGQDELDEAARASAVVEATSSDSEARKCFNRALGHYLCEIGVGANRFDPHAAKTVFDADFPRPRLRCFEDLSLNEFIQVLLHDRTWAKVKSAFGLEKEAVRRLLSNVRDTRNDLFHFRGEISANQRSQLQFCADWLNSQRPTITLPSSAPDPSATDGRGAAPADTCPLPQASDIAGDEKPSAPDQAIMPLEEVGSPDSRYTALARHLQAIPVTKDVVPLTFEQVEAILGDHLPNNARQHRSWWANDSVSHSQSQQWLEAGWRVNRISIADQRVSFARNRERERLYIEFFSAAIADLQSVENLPLKISSPDGKSWQTVATLPKNGPQNAIFTLAFTSRKRFRAELYIDTLDEHRNKYVYDQLHASKVEIEAIVGTALNWERLDSRRASRIALYREGAITDPPAQLEELRAWARDAMPRLYKGLAERAEVALAKSSQ